VFNKSLKWQNGLVLVASYFFYGWWSWKFMGLLMLSTALDYAYGFWVASPNRKKAKFFLWLSIINNLGILAVFKYYNFFATQFQQGLELLGLHTNPVLLNVALPIGISFYTFHGMSYVFDIYRGQQTPVKNFVDYAVFVSFFPLLVAGPIERASHLLPQVQKSRIFDNTVASSGFSLMLWGFFKKVVVADNLAPAINDIFNNYTELDGPTLILGAIYFSFQIYCDFSGYSDIARGLARLFGFELLLNFNNPYLSTSIPEFWKRWHMSLSGWFKDYVYIPLGGSRLGFWKSLRNVFVIFLLSGLWHGANLTFIFWGFLHAVFYIPSFVKKQLTHSKIQSKENYILKIFNILSTFIIVTVAWVFFRSPDLETAFGYLKGFLNNFNLLGILNWRCHTQGSHLEFIFILILFLLSDLFFRKNTNFIFISFLITLILVFGLYYESSSFIYFQF